MTYYQYCQRISGIQWIRDCGDDGDRLLLVVGFIGVLLLILAGIFAIIEAIDADIKKQKAEAELQGLDTEIERINKQNDLYDARLTAQYRQYQLEHLDEFRKEHGL